VFFSELNIFINIWVELRNIKQKSKRKMLKRSGTMNITCEIKKELIGNQKKDIGKKLNLIIYKITNLVNNKIYIGKDKYNNPNYFGSGKNIRRSIKKYGKENFKKEILEFCIDYNDQNIKEKYWISKLNSRNENIGYNISEGGDWGDILSTHPDRQNIIKKISDASIKMWRDPEFKQKMCNMRKGKISPHKGKKRPELLGKTIPKINENFSIKIIDMYKVMGVIKIAKILKIEGFPYGKCAIINFLKRKGLYIRYGKRGPFENNILKKGKDGKFISNIK
jgi:hypothetical protein